MSLESKLESLEQAVVALTAALVASKDTTAPDRPKAEKKAKPAPAAAAAEPEQAAIPTPTPTKAAGPSVEEELAKIKAALMKFKAGGGDPKKVLQAAGFGAFSDVKDLAGVGKVAAELQAELINDEVPF